MTESEMHDKDKNMALKVVGGTIAGVTSLVLVIICPIILVPAVIIGAAGYAGKKIHKRYKRNKKRKDEEYYASQHRDEPQYAPVWEDPYHTESPNNFTYSASKKKGYTFDEAS
jgi:hypothetical protein